MNLHAQNLKSIKKSIKQAKLWQVQNYTFCGEIRVAFLRAATLNQYYVNSLEADGPGFEALTRDHYILNLHQQPHL